MEVLALVSGVERSPFQKFKKYIYIYILYMYTYIYIFLCSEGVEEC